MHYLDPPASTLGGSYPQRVPIKVIGRDGILEHSAIASIIAGQLGEQDEREWHSNRKGAYVSHTFWVVLPDEHAEALLRLAIHALPGVLMQL
jgi:putative lipoic acid-binding regulatory protein